MYASEGRGILPSRGPRSIIRRDHSCGRSFGRSVDVPLCSEPDVRDEEGEESA